jgi:hypothetical protein
MAGQSLIHKARSVQRFRLPLSPVVVAHRQSRHSQFSPHPAAPAVTALALDDQRLLDAQSRRHFLL